jgi:hypothetical protein
LEWQEIPLGTGGSEHVLRVDAQTMEDQRKFVDQRNVGVTLRVLDHLGRFGHFKGGRFVRAGGDDACVQRVDEIRRLRRGAGGDFRNRGESALLIAGIDAFGAVAHSEINVEAKA